MQQLPTAMYLASVVERDLKVLFLAHPREKIITKVEAAT